MSGSLRIGKATEAITPFSSRSLFSSSMPSKDMARGFSLSTWVPAEMTSVAMATWRLAGVQMTTPS